MAMTESLKVAVPVGYLLNQEREILVAVDRVHEAPLHIRLKLVPAETECEADLGATPPRGPHDTPLPTRKARKVQDDDYPGEELGGSD